LTSPFQIVDVANAAALPVNGVKGLLYRAADTKTIYLCELADGSYSVFGGGNSGDSGGHEILDDAGTPLPQRDSLQFSGGLTAHDGSDGQTVVGVADYPIQPVNISPEEGEQDVEERPVFLSSPYAQPFNMVPMYGYQIRVFDGSDTEVYDSGNVEQTSTQFRLPADILQSGETYTWQVRYQSGNLKWSPWSEKTSFETAPVFVTSGISRPQILAPYDGQILNTQTPMILTSQFDADGGLIQGDGDFEVSGDPDFSTLIDSGTGKNAYTVQVPLSHGDMYYARANHKDNPLTTASAWSPRVSFVVKSLFRDTRIGLAVDGSGAIWTTKRIDRNYNPVGLDTGYFAEHPVWASMVSSGTVERPTGQNPSTLNFKRVPKIWVKSGIIETGPYAGWHGVMIDYMEPTSEEKADGWHVHDAFYNPRTGDYQEFMEVGTIGFRGNAENITYANAELFFSNINTDVLVEDNRGWHIQTWREHFLLKLLGYIEYNGTYAFYDAVETSGLYRGMAVLDHSADLPFMLSGLRRDKAIDVTNNIELTIPEIAAYAHFADGSANYKKISGVYQSGQNATLRGLNIDDYLIPTSDTAEGEAVADANPLIYVPYTTVPETLASMRSGVMDSGSGCGYGIAFPRDETSACFGYAKWE
jgi:hypothetical protein